MISAMFLNSSGTKEKWYIPFSSPENHLDLSTTISKRIRRKRGRQERKGKRRNKDWKSYWSWYHKKTKSRLVE
jgi:hypothetical protein